jgi:hypothetical protein
MTRRARWPDGGVESGSGAARDRLAHLAVLREARIRHRAIALELRILFESVAAEVVPSRIISSLHEATAKDPASSETLGADRGP